MIQQTAELQFFCDDARHVVCKPYTIANLHRMAAALNIKRCWSHNHPKHPHYDMPKTRIAEITARCTLVSQRELLEITAGAQ